MSVSTKIAFGTKQENLLQPVLEKFFGVPLIHSPNRFDVFDFYSTKPKFVVEIKSRNCLYNTYASTKIGYNKVEHGLEFIKKKCDVFFIFNFIDGIYWYHLTEDNASYHHTCRYSGKKDYHIPISDLTKIDAEDIMIL